MWSYTFSKFRESYTHPQPSGLGLMKTSKSSFFPFYILLNGLMSIIKCYLNKKLKTAQRTLCIIGNRSWLLIVFPRPKIIIVKFSELQYLNKWIFLQCAGSAWWTMASVVLTICFRITWLGVGWGPSPPPLPAVKAMGDLFKPTFWHWTLSTQKRCIMNLWLAQLVLTHHHCHRLHLLPSATSPGVTVE